jgi:hypothetical protein
MIKALNSVTEGALISYRRNCTVFKHVYRGYSGDLICACSTSCGSIGEGELFFVIISEKGSEETFLHTAFVMTLSGNTGWTYLNPELINKHI